MYFYCNPKVASLFVDPMKTLQYVSQSVGMYSVKTVHVYIPITIYTLKMEHGFIIFASRGYTGLLDSPSLTAIHLDLCAR